MPGPDIDARGHGFGDRDSVGLVTVGGCHAAVSEAVHRLRSAGIAVDYMRIRAFPFAPAVGEFLRAHPRCFVVEQNRDAQLRSLLAIETGVARDTMTALLDYGGLPLTADFVEGEILEAIGSASVPSLANTATFAIPVAGARP